MDFNASAAFVVQPPPVCDVSSDGGFLGSSRLGHEHFGLPVESAEGSLRSVSVSIHWWSRYFMFWSCI